MESESSDARRFGDEELNRALDAYSDEDSDAQNIRNQRLARVHEYEESTVSRADPFAAVIGMGTADLQRVFEHLSGAILAELDNREHTVDEFRELGSDIRLLLKIRKSIEVDLTFQAPDVGQPASAFAAKRNVKGLAKEAIRRNGLLPDRWLKND